MNLNLKQLKDLSEKQLLIVSVSVIALVVIVMGVVIFMGFSQITAYEEEQALAKDAADKFKKTVDQESFVKERLVQGKEYTPTYRKWLVSEQDIAALKVDYNPKIFVSEAAKRASKLTGTVVKVDKAVRKKVKTKRSRSKVKPPFHEDVWTFEILAEAPGLVAFLSLLEQLPISFVEIRSLKVKAIAPKLSKDKTKVEYQLHKVSMEMVAFLTKTNKFDSELLELHKPKDALTAISSKALDFPDPKEIMARSKLVIDRVTKNQKYMRFILRPVVKFPIIVEPLDAFIGLINQLKNKELSKEERVPIFIRAEKIRKSIKSQIASGALEFSSTDLTKFAELEGDLVALRGDIPDVGPEDGPDPPKGELKRFVESEYRSDAFNALARIWKDKGYEMAIETVMKEKIKEAKTLLDDYYTKDRQDNLFQKAERLLVVVYRGKCEAALSDTPRTYEVLSEDAREIKEDADIALQSDDVEVLREGFENFKTSVFFFEDEMSSVPDQKFVAKYTRLFEERIRNRLVNELTDEYKGVMSSLIELMGKKEYEQALTEGRKTMGKLDSVLKSKDVDPAVMNNLATLKKGLTELMAKIEKQWKRELSFVLMLKSVTPVAIIRLNDKYSVLIPYEWKVDDIQTRSYKWFSVGSEIELRISKKNMSKLPKGIKIEEGYRLRVKIVDINNKEVTFQHSDQSDLTKTIKVLPKFETMSSKSKGRK